MVSRDDHTPLRTRTTRTQPHGRSCGYAIEVNGEADQPALIVFDAVHTGRFALEMHVEDDLLGKGEKAVLYIEVRAQ